MELNKYLKPTCIKVNFSLEEISEKLPQFFRSKLSLGTEFSFELPLWVPEGQTPLNIPTDKQVLINAARQELEPWLNKYFSDLLEQERIKESMEHSIRYVAHCLPLTPFEAPSFLILIKCFTIFIILDDVFDGENIIKTDEDGEIISNKLIKMLKVANKNPLSNPIWKKVAKASGKFQQQLLYAVIELDNEFSKIWDDGVSGFGPEIAGQMEANDFMKKHIYNDEGGDYTLDVGRYVRSIEAAGFGITLGYVLEYGKLPEWLNFDPAFQIWSQTGNHISALLNDLLGFKKDVINGETDNMIFYHMRQGLSVQEAITKEIGDFRGYYQDYLKLRDYLLTTESYPICVHMYVRYLDNTIGGVVQVFQCSKKYQYTSETNKILYGEI